MIETYMRSKPFNMIHLCIDEYKDFIIKGVAYNTTENEKIVFHDIQKLIIKMDQIFDRNGNPQAAREMRTFQSEDEFFSYQNAPHMYTTYEDVIKHRGKIITLDIVVLSRRQSSWQGKVFYDNEELEFKNALQMIKIIVKLLNDHIK